MQGMIFIVIMIFIIIYFAFVAFNYYFDKKNKFTHFNLILFKDRVEINNKEERKNYMNFLGKHYFRFTFILCIFVIQGIVLRVTISNGMLKEYISKSFDGVSRIKMAIVIVNIIIVIFLLGEMLNLAKTKQKMIEKNKNNDMSSKN